MMYGIITGLADTDDVNYCPKCGESIWSSNGDGSCECECGFKFYVIEHEDSQNEEQ